jgi:hypothetical protein
MVYSAKLLSFIPCAPHRQESSHFRFIDAQFFLVANGLMSESPDNLDDPLMCPRNKTVKELVRIFDDKRVVLVRGTPACGKSTLARLLYRYYKKLKIPGYLGTWPKEESYQHYDSVIVQHAQKHGYSLAEDNLAGTDMLLTLDGAQTSYHDSGLWLDLMMGQISLMISNSNFADLLDLLSSILLRPKLNFPKASIRLLKSWWKQF